MNKLTSLGLCALLVPAVTLGIGTAVAQDSGTTSEAAKTQPRATPAAPGNTRAQERARPETAQARKPDSSKPMQSLPADTIRAGELIGAAVMSQQNQNFGPINDAIMNQQGQVVAVIVGVGGFLGLGERDVAIKWDSLERRVAQDGTVVFRVDMTDADLRAMPAYRKE